VDQAYNALLEDILSGALKVDQRLTQEVLADRVGLSRTPVREAINRLIMEGFLVRAAGKGLRVAGLGRDEVGQIFELRLKLETYAAERAALHATEAQIAELRAIADVAVTRTPPKTDADMAFLSDCNARFHRLIVEAARSPRISAMLSSAIDLSLVLRTYRMYSPRDLLRSCRHHEEIADAIAARSPKWAASAMATHLLAASTVAMSTDGAPPEQD
jgi:DNA-binding GntR family transcriptional regulator